MVDPLRPRMFWKPEDDRGPGCLSIELDTLKKHARIWLVDGHPTVEWGWGLADTCVELTEADQAYAETLDESREEVAELAQHLARLRLLLAEHGIEDPSRVGLSPRERRVLAEADERDAR